MNWNINIALGEMFGSLILTLAVILGALIIKKNDKVLNSPFKKRAANAVIIGAGVVSGITTAVGFGAGGKINAAISLMVAIFENKWTFTGLEVGFQLVGALAAALIGFAVTKLWKESPSLEETFSFNEQSPAKVVGIESLANIFWLLPVAAVIFNVYGSGNAHASAFEISLFAAITLAVIILAVEGIGAPNLNPQVWFGVYILKLIASKGKITPKQFGTEILSVASVTAIGAIIGAMFYAL